MKVKLLGIWHNQKDRNGNAYVSKKTGKPYEKCTIKDEKGYIYGFGSAATREWKIGDEVEIEVTQNGQWRNFRLPPKFVSRNEFDELKKKVNFLTDEIEYLHNHINSRKAPDEAPDEAPNEEPEVDLEEPEDYGEAI
jgi:hypothetical protein